MGPERVLLPAEDPARRLSGRHSCRRIRAISCTRTYRATQDVFTCWVPLGDVPTTLGGLALLPRKPIQPRVAPRPLGAPGGRLAHHRLRSRRRGGAPLHDHACVPAQPRTSAAHLRRVSMAVGRPAGPPADGARSVGERARGPRVPARAVVAAGATRSRAGGRCRRGYTGRAGRSRPRVSWPAALVPWIRSRPDSAQPRRATEMQPWHTADATAGCTLRPMRRSQPVNRGSTAAVSAGSLPELKPWREAGWVFRDGACIAIERRGEETRERVAGPMIRVSRLD